MSELKRFVVTLPDGKTCEVDAVGPATALFQVNGCLHLDVTELMLKAGYKVEEKIREFRLVRKEDLEWAVNALRSFVDIHTLEVRCYGLKYPMRTDPVDYANERINRLKEALGK